MGSIRGSLDSPNRCSCDYYVHAPDHHDLLLTVESASFDAITALVETAVTWHELDYSAQRLIDPAEWLDFVELHHWSDKDRVVDFFLAVGSLGDGAGGNGLALVVPIRSEDETCRPTPTNGDHPHAQLS